MPSQPHAPQTTAHTRHTLTRSFGYLSSLIPPSTHSTQLAGQSHIARRPQPVHARRQHAPSTLRDARCELLVPWRRPDAWEHQGRVSVARRHCAHGTGHSAQDYLRERLERSVAVDRVRLRRREPTHTRAGRHKGHEGSGVTGRAGGATHRRTTSFHGTLSAPDPIASTRRYDQPSQNGYIAGGRMRIHTCAHARARARHTHKSAVHEHAKHTHRA